MIAVIWEGEKRLTHHATMLQVVHPSSIESEARRHEMSSTTSPHFESAIRPCDRHPKVPKIRPHQLTAELEHRVRECSAPILLTLIKFRASSGTVLRGGCHSGNGSQTAPHWGLATGRQRNYSLIVEGTTGASVMAYFESLFAKTRLRLWSLRMRASLAAVETPTDIPRVHASGLDPDRILLFGSDIFVGRGVLSHEVAFPGYLARSIARKTGRGVDVVIEAHSSLTIEEAVAKARMLELHRYDAVMVDLGLADALGGTPPGKWAAQLEVLLQILTSGVSASAQVFFIESPDPTIVPAFRCGHGHAVADALSRFNVRSQEVIDGFDKATLVSFPVQREKPTDRLHTARTFEGFARTLTPPVVAHLRAEFNAGATRSEPIFSEERRQASVDRLGIVDTGPELRFDRIVAQAQRIFGTQYASFNVIDRDRRWSKSHIGPGGPESARATELCDTTIHTHSGLIVGDATDDSRFRDNPLVTGNPHLRFYAGYPIESPDGQRVGALCVYDTQPRALSGQEEPLLHDLAMKIERELWIMSLMDTRVLA